MRFLVSMLFLAALRAQSVQEAPPARPAPPPPKNLQLLTPEEVRPAMRSYTAGLGVHCDFCHVEGDFASDDKRKKLTARKMIAMTRQINTNFGEEKNRVTCYTCHRGEAEPKSTPPAQAPQPPQQ